MKLNLCVCICTVMIGSRAFGQCTAIEQDRLVPPDSTGQTSANPVVVSGNVLATASTTHTHAGITSGAVWVYRFDGTQWVFEAELLPPDGANNDRFGTGVAINGDRIAVGASTHNGVGAAYIFHFDGSQWTLEAELPSPAPGVDSSFGIAVALDGTTLLVGNSLADSVPGDPFAGIHGGAAYAFTFDGMQWTLQDTLLAQDTIGGEEFGVSIDLDGPRALIGAWKDREGGTQTGSAYVFAFDGTSWTQQAKLIASDGGDFDEFGKSVSLSGTVAVVGAWKHDSPYQDAGAAYVYRSLGSNWIQEAKLTAPNTTTLKSFGTSVSIDMSSVLVGAPFIVAGGQSTGGAAFIYQHHNGVWPLKTTLTASFPSSLSAYGASVSLSGTTGVVGAPFDDDQFLFDGAAYVYSVSCADPCPSDLTGSVNPNEPLFGVPDGILDANDFFYYLNRFAAGDLTTADLTGSNDLNDPSFGVPDGTLDANDFFFYLDLFAQGCP